MKYYNERLQIMTGKERAALRAKANPLDAIIQIGKEGITENLIKQIDDTLDVRELIKIRVHLETSPASPRDAANELAQKLGAEVIQVIGGIIVLYREIDEEKLKCKKAQNSSSKKSAAKKKVKIKGMRQRKQEAEEKNPWLKAYNKYNRGRRS